MKPADFQKAVLNWFDRHGRKDLPWQINPTPYRVWVSEIMLQQTQVLTVIPFFKRFIDKFPDPEALGSASTDTILHYWSGLGYYARARNMQKAAKLIVERGGFPPNLEELVSLPGIGRSTAGAIISIGFKKRAPILDGNVKRVFARFHVIEGWPGNANVSRELWQLSDHYTPDKRVAEYTQAIMDLGATLCTRAKPACDRCPVRPGCQGFRQGRVSELPMRRPKKVIPVRKCYWLVLRDDRGHFSLERRPVTGVWGGLWAFSEFEQKNALIDWCYLQEIDQDAVNWLPERRHTFSHFHLDYTPALVRQNNSIPHVAESNRTRWYDPKAENRLGLPAPVSRLLDQLATESAKKP